VKNLETLKNLRFASWNTFLKRLGIFYKFRKKENR
jgi:hypothetical protein